MKKTDPKVLFIRLDRIGDLVLSLPVDEFCDEATWWIPRGLKFITDHSIPPRAAVEIPLKLSYRSFFQLLRATRRHRFDAAVVFHAPWWASLLIWLARIPVRVGVRSQWHSFLFFNRGIRQKRSRAEQSELEYNYRLVEAGLGIEGLPRRTLKLSSTENVNRFDLVEEAYTVVHPGMGGSALNWPIENYERLIRHLLARGDVAITGTASDEPYLAPLRESLADAYNGTSSPGDIVWLDGRLSGSELIAVLQKARSVVAPSTGVLHLAASTGVRTLGLFSPVRVQKPERWGPQGSNARVLVPQFPCPGEFKCLGEACTYYDCMTRITPAMAFDRLTSPDKPQP